MATAVQSFSSMLRKQIEEALNAKGGARLALAPRLVRDGFQTGYQTLDAVLHGGLPVAGTTEIVGGRSSGRATLAAAYIAQRTREGHVCAWVDAEGGMSPEACLANGMDTQRLLWVRCSGAAESMQHRDADADRSQTVNTKAAPLRVVAYGRDKSIGTPGVPNRALASAGEVREVQVASDRLPPRRGSLVLHSRPAILPSRYEADGAKRSRVQTVRVGDVEAKTLVRSKRPRERLEQAVKAVDLLVQAGGFGAIVLDMGGIAAETARKIPLATWFRWRAALERTRTCLLVLSPFTPHGSQLGCAGSSAELVLRVEAELPEPGTVMLGVSYRLEVVRRRFAEASTAVRKKGPGRATSWDSRAQWVAS